MQSDEVNLTERRYLWLSATTTAALKTLSGGRRREEAAIMRAGIEAEVARRQAIAPTVDHITAAMIANARARGIDVGAVLTAALTASYAADPATQRTGTEG